MRTVIHRYFTQLGEVEVNLLELVKVPAGKALFINDEYRNGLAKRDQASVTSLTLNIGDKKYASEDLKKV
jgi:hypothetical protein